MTTFSAVQLIEKKRDNFAFSEQEIQSLVRAYLSGEMAEYQMSALLMAIYLRGMTDQETFALTKAMLNSGDLLQKGAPMIVDKHSTGGVGDKTSLIVGPLAHSLGLFVPMIAGRGLGHTGGTIDKLESIPGFKTQFSIGELRSLLRKNRFFISGAGENIVPADRKIYALRDVTGTVNSIPLITASIMSKKLAEGLGGLVLDIKIGTGSFLKTKTNAKEFARLAEMVAKRFKVKTKFFITDMSEPLGQAVGNSLEVLECIRVMKGDQGPKDLIDLSIKLAGAMLMLSGKVKSLSQGEKLATTHLQNGSALSSFRQLIKMQGGDDSIVDHEKLPLSKVQLPLLAPKSGIIRRLDALEISQLAIMIGAGRKQVTDAIDFGVGFYFHRKCGQKVRKGEPIATVYLKERGMFPEVEKVFRKSALKISS